LRQFGIVRETLQSVLRPSSRRTHVAILVYCLSRLPASRHSRENYGMTGVTRPTRLVRGRKTAVNYCL